MRTFYSFLCALSLLACAAFLIASWHGILTLGELGRALSTYRATPFALMILSGGLAGLFALLASRQPLQPEKPDTTRP